MLRSAFLMMGLIVLTTVSSAQAAVIQFYGNIASKVGPAGVLQFANNTPFTAYLSVNVSNTNQSTVAFGGFKFGNTEITVSGGTVEIKNGNEFEFLFAPGDTTLFTLNGAPNGTPGIAFIGFNFTGVSGLGTGINQTQLGKLNGSTTNFTLSEFGGLPIYSGSITAIPEPSSMLVLGGLVAGFGGWRLRRRKLAQKAA